jgi:hypothetical protein
MRDVTNDEDESTREPLLPGKERAVDRGLDFPQRPRSGASRGEDRS